jgi:hypothetical protein
MIVVRVKMRKRVLRILYKSLIRSVLTTFRYNYQVFAIVLYCIFVLYLFFPILLLTSHVVDIFRTSYLLIARF